jgi:hypothetical protein
VYKVSLSSDDPKSTILPNVTDGRTDKASYRVASLLKMISITKFDVMVLFSMIMHKVYHVV